MIIYDVFWWIYVPAKSFNYKQESIEHKLNNSKQQQMLICFGEKTKQNTTKKQLELYRNEFNIICLN